MAKKDRLPSGFVCGGCNVTHRFPPYVYAHWDYDIDFTCPTADCGRKHLIQSGTVSACLTDGTPVDAATLVYER